MIEFPVVDAVLRVAWEGVAPGVRLRGLAAATAAGRAACAVATDVPLTGGQLQELAGAVGAAIGVGTVEVAATSADDLTGLIRQWVNQAAQGAGRGVSVRVEEEADGSVRVLLRAVDSSARELAMRLASPYEPALPALRALLGAAVTVEDAESVPGAGSS